MEISWGQLGHGVNHAYFSDIRGAFTSPFSNVEPTKNDLRNTHMTFGGVGK